MDGRNVLAHVRAIEQGLPNLRAYLHPLSLATIRQVAQRLRLPIGNALGLYPKAAMIRAIEAHTQKAREHGQSEAEQDAG